MSRELNPEARRKLTKAWGKISPRRYGPGIFETLAKGFAAWFQKTGRKKEREVKKSKKK